MLKLLYDQVDTDDLWLACPGKHLVEDLGMIQSIADPPMYFLFEENKLIRINGIYVDDLLRCGTLELEEQCKLTSERFETTVTKEFPFTFAEFNISPRPDDTYSIDQLFYHQKLESLEASASWSYFCSMRMKLTWLAHSRPDLLVDISQIWQVTEQNFTDDQLMITKRLNTSIKYANDNPAQMTYPKLDLATLRMVCYSDAVFTSNADFTTQLGRILLIADANGHAVRYRLSPISLAELRTRSSQQKL